MAMVWLPGNAAMVLPLPNAVILVSAPPNSRSPPAAAPISVCPLA